MNEQDKPDALGAMREQYNHDKNLPDGQSEAPDMGLQNPRFVLNIGAIRDCFPDMPEQGDGLVLWDRQCKQPVLTLHAAYGNAICLETNDPCASPFSDIERWFNSLNDLCLVSEGMDASDKEYDRHAS